MPPQYIHGCWPGPSRAESIQCLCINMQGTRRGGRTNSSSDQLKRYRCIARCIAIQYDGWAVTVVSFCFSMMCARAIPLYILVYSELWYDCRMEKSFQSAPDLIQGEELIRKITASANSRRQRRPVLVAWSFRVEKSLHSDLQKAAGKLNPVAMSDIVNGLLEIFLPTILAQRASPGEKLLSDPSQRSQLASLLESLSGLLQKGGDL